MEFEFAHLLDAVGAVQPHPAQLPAFQSPPSDLIPSAPPRRADLAPSAPPLPSEVGSQPQPRPNEINEINEVDAFASDGDLIGELLPWLDEEVPPAPAGPAVDEVRSDEAEVDSIDSLLAELTETGPHPIVVSPPDTVGPATTNPLAMPKPAAAPSRVAETLLPPPPPPPPPVVVDRVRESLPADVPPPPPPAPAARSADPIVPAHVARVAPAPEPIVVDTHLAEPVAPRSRFADRGLSDDLLPGRDRKRRR